MEIFTSNNNHFLYHKNFPRSSRYNPELVFSTQMGPNVLWLTEQLVKNMNLKPGMRILDMGCGKALSSIFLALEYDVMVWANDLWIDASDNWERVCAAKLENKIFPIKAEAHALPYAKNFFDAVISIDSYQYYGTCDLYLGYFHQFVKPGGEIGIVVPGLHKPLPDLLPKYMTEKQKSGSMFWEWDMVCFHTSEWWKKHWSRYPFLQLGHCLAMPDGGTLWLEWERALEKWEGEKLFLSDVEALEKDDNTYFTFVEVIGKRI